MEQPREEGRFAATGGAITLPDLCPRCGHKLTQDWTGIWCPVCLWCQACQGTGCLLCRDVEDA